jgi:DNA-binding transcriptional LysR family regulator
MKLSQVDLNLLVALDVLLETRSVTATARRLALSQSAMSHQLARLRNLFDDALLVRARDVMLPTPRAQSLAGPLRAALAQVDLAVTSGGRWDPSTSKRAFHVGTGDYFELVLLPPLVACLSREAPGVDLSIHPLDLDIGAQLASGEIDLAIGPATALDHLPKERRAVLAAERFVCVMRKDHPLAKKKLTLDRYCDARHALVSSRGRPEGLVDEALAAMGRSRRVVVTVPHFSVTPLLVAESDLLLTVAERIATRFADSLPLHVTKPPLELSGVVLMQAWHERTHDDPAHRWLRGEMDRVIRAAGHQRVIRAEGHRGVSRGSRRADP